MKIEVFEINVFSLGKIKNSKKHKKTCFLHQKLFVCFFYDKKHQINQPWCRKILARNAFFSATTRFRFGCECLGRHRRYYFLSRRLTRGERRCEIKTFRNLIYRSFTPSNMIVSSFLSNRFLFSVKTVSLWFALF